MVIGGHLLIWKISELLVTLQRADLIPRQIMNIFADVRELRIIRRGGLGVRAFLVFDFRIVPHRRHAVLRKDNVHFESARAFIDRRFKSLFGFFGVLTTATAVCLKVKTREIDVVPVGLLCGLCRRVCCRRDAGGVIVRAAACCK